jgi:type II secretory pathway pseudopilin PulG
MREESTKHSKGFAGSGGFSVLEVVIVCAVALFLAAIATPQFLKISYDIRLKSAATNVSALMQEARILAAKNNKIYTISFPTGGGGQACIYDVTAGTPACVSNQITVTFNPSITPASGAPRGSGGQPTAYSLVGDTGSVTPYDNATTLGYSARGLPCAYASSTCSTPAASYFVYYFNDARPDGSTGWAAVLVTRTGRTKSLTWNGSSWY